MSGILLLTLASCDVLFIGVFPASAGQATARTNLSGDISSSVAGSFRFTSVTTFGKEFFILFTDIPFDSSKTHIVIMNSDLEVINKYTLQEAFDFTPPSPFMGTQAMVDFNGAVVIGNCAFVPFPSGFTYVAGSKAVLPPLTGPSVSGAPSFFYNEVNFRVSGGDLMYDEYDVAWGANGGFNPLLGTPSPPPQSQLQVLNVFTDHDSSLFPDLLVFRDDGSERTYFIAIPKSEIDAGPVDDIFANYGPTVVKSNLARDSISFTYDGAIAYDQSQEALIRFKMDDPENEAVLPLKRSEGMKAAAGIYGGYCVVWDPATRVVTRYEKWW